MEYKIDNYKRYIVEIVRLIKLIRLIGLVRYLKPCEYIYEIK